MWKLTLVMLVFGLSANILMAGVTREFPTHWGQPPAIQTRDYVTLPDGYGHGSSTLARWIAANLEKDKAAKPSPASPAARVLFETDFEKAEPGKLPDDFMSLNGEFVVREEGGNNFLELPGAPLDSFAAQFGPVEVADVAVRGRVFGTAKGRRFPTFGVGLNGVSGYKLQLAPAKKALELLKDEAVKASVAYEWKPAAWTQLRLQVSQAGEGEWKISGKAWPHGSPEPDEWMISCTDAEAPIAGRSSVMGSPFAGTPIRFDDLKVERVTK
ncbi:MAG: hypothetical protein KJ070_05540 [Verrucomicrobia bacterium]|nr:hypothetical protein [Verrucomicrobiota bacterium]